MATDRRNLIAGLKFISLGKKQIYKKFVDIFNIFLNPF